jgi:hypothetical protein
MGRYDDPYESVVDYDAEEWRSMREVDLPEYVGPEPPTRAEIEQEEAENEEPWRRRS